MDSDGIKNIDWEELDEEFRRYGQTQATRHLYTRYKEQVGIDLRTAVLIMEDRIVACHQSEDAPGLRPVTTDEELLQLVDSLSEILTTNQVSPREFRLIWQISFVGWAISITAAEKSGSGSFQLCRFREAVRYDVPVAAVKMLAARFDCPYRISATSHAGVNIEA